MLSHTSIVIEVVGGVVALLLIAAGVQALSKRFEFPFSIALVLVGMGLASVADYFPLVADVTATLKVSPELILFVFLPTLIFETAFNLDVHLLRANLAPILVLAAPGLLLSTLIIGIIVSAGIGIPLIEALLLGAILSATDPVAVIALFKQLGVPNRLTTLVEGESLFNDATAIVLSRLLVAIIAAGTFTFGDAVAGAFDFIFIFVGGAVVGSVLAILAGKALGSVESDPTIEITLTTTLAYLSFLVAEEFFGVSGVMATVAAGLTLGGRGRTKISVSVREYLDSFWEYMAFVANALIFLLVGLQVELGELIASFDQLIWVIIAMLLSRIATIYLLVPLAARWPGSQPVDLRFQTVMCWGGLRGAIALAIVMCLPAFDRFELFVTLVTGSVLFTLLVQGLTMDRLVRMLRLDTPPLADRFARFEGGLMAAQRALDRLPELTSSGHFSRTISRRLHDSCEQEIKIFHDSLEQLRRTELDPGQERQLLLRFGFTEEKACYTELLGHGHLSEKAFNELALTLDLQIDAIRNHEDFTKVDYHHLRRWYLQKLIVTWLDRVEFFAPLVNRHHLQRIAHDYEVIWGRLQGSLRVLESLEENIRLKTFSPAIVAEVREMYKEWRDRAVEQLDQDAERAPEFVTAMQERLGNRLSLLAKIEVIEEQAERGALPRSVAEEVCHSLFESLVAAKGIEIEALQTDPAELLKKVPFFADLSEREFIALAAMLQPRSFAIREDILRQGDAAASVFFIARGVVRVSRTVNGEERNIATLMMGDFFGEMALLHDEPRTATVRAVTPCSLYELDRKHLFELMDQHPAIRRAIEDADAERRN